MSESSESSKDPSLDMAPVDAVWPPAIEYHPPDRPPPLSKVQQERVRYFWLYCFNLPLSVGIGAKEYLSTSPGWWQSPVYKTTLICVCLLGFIGNLWRVWQGWQIKAALKMRD